MLLLYLQSWRWAFLSTPIFLFSILDIPSSLNCFTHNVISGILSPMGMVYIALYPLSGNVAPEKHTIFRCGLACAECRSASRPTGRDKHQMHLPALSQMGSHTPANDKPVPALDPCPFPQSFWNTLPFSLPTSTQTSTQLPPPWPFWGRRKMTPWTRRLVLSSGAKLKLCSHPDTPRTKLVTETEFCWSKERRWPLLRSRKTSLSAQAQEGSLGVRKGAGATHKCGHAPTGLCSGIHLSKKLPTPLAKGPRTSLVWKRKQDNWLKVLQYARPWRSGG